MKNEMDSSPKSEIILYQPNETVSLEVRMENETVWLSINQMSELFGRDKSVISRHIAAIYNEAELEREATVAKNATVQNENGRTHNPNFKVVEFDHFKMQAGLPNFVLSASEWIEKSLRIKSYFLHKPTD